MVKRYSYIPTRLKNAAENDYVAGAEDILDDALNKTQEEINGIVLEPSNGLKDRVEQLEEQVSFDGSWEAAETASAVISGSPGGGYITTANAVRGAIDVRTGYFKCTTEGSTAAKAVTAAGYVLTRGGGMRIFMEHANTADNATLNINSTGAKALFYNDERAGSDNSWEDEETITVYYDETANSNAGAYFASNAQGGGGKAEKIKYDNSTSGLAANNMQGALDEVASAAISTNTLEVDLSKYTPVMAFPSPDKWLTEGPYKGIFISISPNKKCKIKANAEFQGYYCFLTTNTYSRNAYVNYATGCTRVDILNDTEAIDIAPSDANYLYIATYTTHDVTPQLVELSDARSVKEIVSEAEVTDMYKQVNTWEIIGGFTVGKYIATSQGVGNSCPMTTSDLSSMNYIKIAANAGEKYRIIGVGGNNPRLWATVDKNTSKILAAFDGYVGSQSTPFDEIIEIQQDCWLIINVYNGSASPAYYNDLETPYSLQKAVTWSVTGNEEITIPTWELGTWSNSAHADSTVRIRNKGVDILEAGTYIFSINNGYQFYLFVDGQSYSFRTLATITLTKKSDIQIILRLSSDESLSDYVPSEFVAESGFKIMSDISTIKHIYNDISNINNYLKRGEFGDSLPIGDDTTIIATRRNFMLKYGTDEGVDYLYFSDDLGSTWTSVQNIYGNIVHAHWFNDGTCLFCTEQHCYYTKDFVTVNESTVYDYDGTVSTPSGHRFYNIPKGTDSYMIDGKEFHLWYDYILLQTLNPRLWYSNDNGVTVRAAFAFGESSINGSVLSARHGHGFKYNPYNDYFYAWTGDTNEECHIIRGKYQNNTWTWEHVATGPEYKFGTILFSGGNMFCVTDYGDVSLADKKGLLSCPVDNINSENFEYLYKVTDIGSASLSDIWIDKSGWKVMVPDYVGGNSTLIANKGFKFKWVANTRAIRINGFTGPNYNGDVYCKYATSSAVSEDTFHIMKPTINLTEAMHTFGAYDFSMGVEFDSIIW